MPLLIRLKSLDMNLPALSRQERKNVALILALAVVVGVGSFVLRTKIPRFDLPLQLRAFEISLFFVLLGLLPIMALRARTAEGRAMAVFLLFAGVVGLGATLQAVSDISANVLLSATILLMGLFYLNFFQGTVRHLIYLIGLIVLEIYLFAAWYLVRSVMVVQNLQIVIGLLLLTMVAAVIYKMFKIELRKSGQTTYDV